MPMRLLACAASEDRIADIVTGLFPISDELQAQVDGALPGGGRALLRRVRPVHPGEQLYLQSEAEIQGSQAWVRMSEQITDEATLASLRECTELELQSSVAAKAVLDALESIVGLTPSASTLAQSRVMTTAVSVPEPLPIRLMNLPTSFIAPY